MKKQFATVLIGLVLLVAPAFAREFQLGASYDYYRGLPDGSWNGNNGALISANLGQSVANCVSFQLGGSYGIYDWDGRGQLVFSATKAPEHVGLLTTGFSTSINNISFGVVCDLMSTQNYSLFDQNPFLAQIRLQSSYLFGSDEVGIWGTYHLNHSDRLAYLIPVTYKAIDQINLFWTHYLSNSSQFTLWAGAPYTYSLLYRKATPGIFNAGFALKAPMTERFAVEGYGYFMKAKRLTGWERANTYGASVCLGITYNFGGGSCAYREAYVPLANHANFMVDVSTLKELP